MIARTTSPGRAARNTRRAVSAAAIVPAIVGAVALVLPGAAHAADSNNGKTLGFVNDSVCTAQAWAGSQVRAEGTATRNGAKFFLYKDGAPVYTTTPTSAGFAAEFRSRWGTFTGAGWYQVCAVNKQTTLTYATVRLRTDGDVPL